MRLHVDPEHKQIILHVAKQTLSTIALALERGFVLTPDIVRNAELDIVKEQGQETLAIRFGGKENEVANQNLTKGLDLSKFNFGE